MTPRGIILIGVVAFVAVIGGGLQLLGLADEDPGRPTAVAEVSSATLTVASDTTTTTTAAENATAAAVQLQPIVVERLPASAEQAVRAFAMGWTNWRAATAVDAFRRLAGSAAYQAQQAALERARRLQQQGAAADRANEGRLQTVRDRGRGRFVVVARERTTAAGAAIGPEHFTAYLAVAQQTPRGWQITTWKEQT